MNKVFEQLIRKAEDLKLGRKPKIAIQLGTGQSHLFDSHLSNATKRDYDEIFSTAGPTALTHRGEMTLGSLEGCEVAVFAGRLHLYEGHSALAITHKAILSKLLGCETMIISNAAGALNQKLTPGGIMQIEDHLNLTGENPLIGLPDSMAEHFGIDHPFVDMSQAYSPKIINAFCEIADELNLDLQKGVYAGLKGPSLETSAERRMLSQWGADSVGMSTVNEVIMCRYLSLDVAGFSIITNMATGGAEQAVDDIDDILKHADAGGTLLVKLIREYCRAMR